jgi:hypothetical protein
MIPDFNQKTVDTIAKRAAYRCSNPDCRVITVGPNSDLTKSTVIGEAAHIYGARSNSKRYNTDMTDSARAEITNSIWLCCNCHKLIDTDEQKYSSDVLFAWREQHEKYIYSEIGNSTDRILYNEQITSLDKFNECPPIIRRIVIDKPVGWEYRLTAELMRYFNRPLFRRINDLRDGLYVKHQSHIAEDNVIKWIQHRLSDVSKVISPLTVLLEKLNNSWGPPGKPGNVDEIYHITCLIRDWLEQMILYEEEIYFANVPDEYQELISLFKNIIGSQAEKLAEIPDSLDEIVFLLGTNHGGTIENPLVVKKVITFEVPPDWTTKFDYELNKIKKRKLTKNISKSNGCLILIIGSILLWLLIKIFN